MPRSTPVSQTCAKRAEAPRAPEWPWTGNEGAPELTAAELADASPDQRSYLRIALEVLRNSGGCTTPVENMIEALLRRYGYGILNPAVVNETVSEFHQEYSAMIADCEKFMRYRAITEFPSQTETAPRVAAREAGRSQHVTAAIQPEAYHNSSRPEVAQ